jgi:hypothetical protein
MTSLTRQLRRKQERKDKKTDEQAVSFISREINSANKEEILTKLQERLDNDESLAIKGSYSWFLEDTKRIFHSTLRTLDDVNLYTSKNPGEENRIYVVYFRWNPTKAKYEVQVKIGKSFSENGEVARDRKTSNDPDSLVEIGAIPCSSETAAYLLEYMYQYILGSKKTKIHREVQQTVANKFPREKHIWIDGDSGIEFFDFSNYDKSQEQELLDELLGYAELFKAPPLNKRNFDLIKQPQQDAGGNKLADFVTPILKEYFLNVGNPELALREAVDFFLLMKPRGKKNATSLYGLSLVTKQLNEAKIPSGKSIDVAFTGLWPSAFPGFINDGNSMNFGDHFVPGFVDMSLDGYKEKREQLIAEGCNVIFIFFSIQSVDEKVSKAVKDDIEFQDESGVIHEEFDNEKYKWIKSLNILVAILDECDHGLRNGTLSEKVVKSLDFKIRINLSGSDLYAMKHLTEPGNHYVYTILDEEVAIENDDINMPYIQKVCVDLKEIPFLEKLSEEEMDHIGVGRRINSMFLTHTKIKIEKANSVEEKKRLFKVEGFKEEDLLDGDGNEITSVNETELDAYIQNVIVNSENSGYNFLDHNHIFVTVPSKLGGMALHNLLKKKKYSNHKITTGWHFNNASTIESEMKDFMGVTRDAPTGTERTIIIVCAKMLRGSSCPWSAVFRFDGYNDFKIGHQIDLRSQNDFGPDGKTCLVFDANPFRAIPSAYEIAKSCSNGKNTSKKFETMSNRFLPISMGKFNRRTVSRAEVIESYQVFKSITECFDSDAHLDKDNLQKNKENLEEVLGIIKQRLKLPKGAGKSSTRTQIPGSGSTPPSTPDEEAQLRKEMRELLRKGKAITSALPTLQYLTPLFTTGGKTTYYSNIKDLFDNVDSVILKEWLYTLRIDTDIDIKDLISIFVEESINLQLLMSSRKMKRGLDLSEISSIISTGNVPVSRALAIELLEKLPKDFWKNKNLKIFDPCVGDATFLIICKEKLLEAGVSEEEIKNILHYADWIPLNVRLANKKLDLNNGFCYNIRTGKDKNGKILDPLSDLKEKLENMKHNTFNLYVTNPPFASTDYLTGERDDQAKNLHAPFTKLGHDLTDKDDYIAMVQPTGWANTTTADIGKGNGKNSVHFYKDYMQKYETLYININECKRHFTQNSTFSAFVIRKTEADRFVTEVLTDTDEFDVDLRDVNDLPVNCNRIVIEISSKVLNNGDTIPWKGNNLNGNSESKVIETIKKTLSDEEMKKFKSNKSTPEKYFQNEMKEFLKEESTGDYKFPVYLTPAKGGRWVYVKEEHKSDNLGKPKIMFSISGNFVPVYDPKGEYSSSNFCCVYYLQENETVENAKSVLEHPLYKFLEKSYNFSGYTSSVLGSLPKLDFTKEWTVTDIYEHFNITEDERKYIEDRT